MSILQSIVLRSIVLVCLGLASAVQAGEYAVIVHSDNPHNVSAADIRVFYLKQRGKWPKGEDVQPFARKLDSEENQAFFAAILKMTKAELTRHWLDRKQTVGDTPPRNVSSDNSVMRLVAKYPGAFAVIKAEKISNLKEGVKVLFKFNH